TSARTVVDYRVALSRRPIDYSWGLPFLNITEQPPSQGYARVTTDAPSTRKHKRNRLARMLFPSQQLQRQFVRVWRFILLRPCPSGPLAARSTPGPRRWSVQQHTGVPSRHGAVRCLPRGGMSGRHFPPAPNSPGG